MSSVDSSEEFIGKACEKIDGRKQHRALEPDTKIFIGLRKILRLLEAVIFDFFTKILSLI